MILPSKNQRVFDNNIAKNKWFYNGHMNLQTLEFDPFVTGYSFIVWTKIPSWVEKQFPGFKAMTQKNFKSFQGLENIEMTTNDYMHTFNGNNYRTAASITKGNTGFQMTHQEFSGSPIKNMYQYWVSGIRDPRTGIATYPKIHNLEYAAKNHTGELLYIQTRPDANNTSKNNIEFAAYYTAVIPTRISLDHHNYTMETHEEAQIEQDFAGNMEISARVNDFAKSKLNEIYSFTEQGMFDPSAPKTAGDNLSDFDYNKGGITGSGNGDLK
ncbi:hypothetical protein PALS2_169 [Staphylococcus phage PALS_2]|nr:hypothetical protein PALS2_169 [Staphylococcus phage PALS_2]